MSYTFRCRTCCKQVHTHDESHLCDDCQTDLQRRLDLAWKRMEPLLPMAALVRTQDNAITSDPIFMVQRRRRIFGMDPNYSDHFAWLTDDSEYEAEGDELRDIELRYEDSGRERDDIDGWHRVAYLDIWENVQPFFTRAGAEHYIHINGHNLRPETRIFVESGYRNAEWIAVRAFLNDLAGKGER
jgi:hypothetical protein